jgi:hypothetical protein
VNGKALLGCRCPAIVASPWTVGIPSNPTVNHVTFDHTSVLQMIESVFSVPPLAARETSNDVGNLLSAIDFNHVPMAAPALPQPQSVFPQALCLGGLGTAILSPHITSRAERRDNESHSFLMLEQAARQRGWPVYQ